MLQRRALEGDYSFVKGKITLESNQVIFLIYGCGLNRGDEVALGLLNVDFRQRDRCYFRRNLTATAAITRLILCRAAIQAIRASPISSGAPISRRDDVRRYDFRFLIGSPIVLGAVRLVS